MLALLFPGQGSQMRGMGAELFDVFPDITKKADEILNYSIKHLCLENPNEQLNQTQYTQPALFTVSVLMYLQKCKDLKMKPDYVAGHSLGEYSALFAANVFDFETGLQLVRKRGELMSQAKDGGMAAIIGLSLETLQNTLQENQLTNIAIANHNSYTQIVISGLKKDIEQAQTIFKTIKSANFIPLKVSGAFHSPYMEKAQQGFSEFLTHFKFQRPTLPIIANVNALPYHPAVIQDNLISQISHSVKWISTIEYLNAQGNMTFEEIGPGNVLKGLLQRIEKGQ